MIRPAHFLLHWLPAALRAGACLALALLTAPLFALDPSHDASSYSLRAWRIEDGLPSGKIRKLMQTPDGHLWMATAQGAARFDGTEFVVYDTHTRKDLATCNFNDVARTADGTMWFGSASGGLHRFRDDQFKAFTMEDGLPSNFVRALTVNLAGDLVVITSRGLAFVRDDKLIPVSRELQAALESGGCRAYLQRADGTQLIAADGGLWSIVGDKVVQLSGTAGLPATGYVRLMETKDGRLWIGSFLGLYCQHPDGRVEKIGGESSSAALRILSLETDRDDNLWIGTFGGLYRLQGRQLQAAVYPEAFGVNTITSLMEDSEGTLWVASNLGLFRLSDSPFTPINHNQGLDRSGVHAVYQTRDGAWWFGMWAAGVFRYEGGKATRLEGMPAGINIIYNFLESEDGSLWICTSSGLFRHLNGTVISYYVRKDQEALRKQYAARPTEPLSGMIHGRPHNIVSDKKGGFWISTREFVVYHFENEQFRLYSRGNGLEANNLRYVLSASNGDIWASMGNVAVRFENGRWTLPAPADNLPKNQVCWLLFEDSTGAIWVPSEAHGLSRFKNGRWDHFSTREGLLHDAIAGLAEDKLGNLWIGTPKGLMRIALQEFDDFTNKKIPALLPRMYNRDDGIPFAECSLQSSPGMWTTQDGRILVASESGALVIDPDKVVRSTRMPRVSIKQLVVAGTALDIEKEVSIPAGSRDIELRYTAVNLLAPEKTRFKLRLEPLDTEWTEVGGRRDIRYPRLAPGNYVFHVIACNNDGVWNTESTSVAFTVRPFFYQTKWFLALLGMVVLGVVFGGYRWRSRRLRRRALELQRQNQELEQRISERTEALRASQQKLMHASRLAGMAEIATGVVHNIGNVLTSVNTATTVAAEKIKALKFTGLSKIGELLGEQKDRLGEFFAKDPRAAQVPGYLTKLAGHLEAQRAESLRELEVLHEHVEQIKAIVAAQQGHAHASDFVEVFSPSELVDGAILIADASLATPTVQMKRRFNETPNIQGDRQKAVQILVNLIRNAKEACLANSSSEQSITVTLQAQTASDRVRIDVTDTGVGVSPENLTNIFAFGHTTKHGGRGFGLHTSANAAREMGGSLRAESAGPGKGATFILEIPIAHVGDDKTATVSSAA